MQTLSITCPSESVNTKTMLHMGKCSSTSEIVFARSGEIRILTRTYLKNKISVQGKARNGEKAEHTRSM